MKKKPNLINYLNNIHLILDSVISVVIKYCLFLHFFALSIGHNIPIVLKQSFQVLMFLEYLGLDGI